ncbi:MAG: efflux RND transporter periplasmic adaptor subunit [Nitrospirota bacterium]
MRKRLLIFIILIILAALVAYKIIAHIKSKDNLLTVSGRVEASEIELAARVSGRLESVLIEDGMIVKKGASVALIEDAELQSKRRELINRIDEINERLGAAELDLDYTVNSVDHSIDEARKALSVAEARLKQAEASRENAGRDYKRYSNLLEKEVISKQRYDNVRLAYEISGEEVHVALKEVERAKVSLMKAEDSKKLVKAKERELLALSKSIGQLKEGLQQVEIQIGYTRINAPSDGVILKKVSEPGEVVTPGGVIGVMINPENIHIRTYVPEKYIGKININMEADVFADAYPDKPFTGNVCYISDKAEFTPKEVQSYEERVKQVFAVKICFPQKEDSASKNKTPYEVFKKGMPVDVRFGIKTR